MYKYTHAHMKAPQQVHVREGYIHTYTHTHILTNVNAYMKARLYLQICTYTRKHRLTSVGSSTGSSPLPFSLSKFSILWYALCVYTDATNYIYASVHVLCIWSHFYFAGVPHCGIYLCVHTCIQTCMSICWRSDLQAVLFLAFIWVCTCMNTSMRGVFVDLCG